jgi:hypothetical protein
MTLRSVTALLLAVLLSACAFQRSDDAAAAKAHMVGLSREEILACMGPPKKKAHEGTTEVWSYLSGNGRSDYSGDGVKVTGYGSTTSTSLQSTSGNHTRSFCTVNVVMNDGVVKRVNYNGPTSSYWLTTDDQCSFAVANCLTQEKETKETP